jgi:hypothetical protein
LSEVILSQLLGARVASGAVAASTRRSALKLAFSVTSRETGGEFAVTVVEDHALAIRDAVVGFR